MDTPYKNYSKILGISQRSKTIQFLHFFAWLTDKQGFEIAV